MRFYDYMAEHGLTDDRMAKMIGGGVSPSAVFNWRYGHRIPKPDSLRRIEKISGGSVGISDFIAERDRVQKARKARA